MLCPQEYLPHLIRLIQQHDIGLLPCGKRADILVHSQRPRRVLEPALLFFGTCRKT